MKETLFIEFENDIFVPRPTSVNAGLARSIWMKKFFLNRNVIIAAPSTWEYLKKNGKVQKLVEREEQFLVEEL